MKSAKRVLSSTANSFSTPEARFYAFIIFLVLVFFTGGGSRDDIQSLLLLRPLAVLFCAYALALKTPERLAGRMFPLYMIGVLLALMVLQLIPLPPSIWTELEGRQNFADIADIAGIEQPWRPLTLSPSKTLNSLFSLAVPIAAMLLYLNLDRKFRKRAVSVIIVLCGISALWAVFQIVGSSHGPLYTYRITNFGNGVGLFANRNHQAVILASAIVMLGWYAASLKPRDNQVVLKFYASLATILVFVPLIFVTGSRAGLLLMFPALLLALSFIIFGDFYSERLSKRNKSPGRKTNRFSGRSAFLTISIVTIAGIAVSSIILSRSLAFDRLFSSYGIAELRLQLLPTLFTMLKDYMPFGSGFGSFEHVYRIYEQQALLSPNYLNQAHNDWLQFPIEGGIPAILIAACSIFWFVKRLLILAKKRHDSGPTKHRGLMCAIVILFLLAASFADYPLRVPSIVAVFSILVCVFNDSIRSVQHREIKHL